LAGCGCGAASDAGSSTAPLVPHAVQPALLAVGLAHVYWTEADGVLRAAKKSDGTVTELVSSAHATALAADDARAYYATESAVYAIAEPDGAETPRPTQLAAVNGARAFAMDDMTLYLATGSRVVAVPKAGGDARVVAEASGDVSALAASPIGVYYASGAAVFLAGAKVATADAPIRALVSDLAGPAWVSGDTLVQHNASGADRVLVRASLGDALVARATSLYFVEAGALARVDTLSGDHARFGDTLGVGKVGLGTSTIYYTASTPDGGEIGQVLQ
jgi:hypothetical protein